MSIDIVTIKQKLLHIVMAALAILAALMAISTDATSVLGMLLSHVPGGSTTAVLISLALAFLTKLPTIVAFLKGIASQLGGGSSAAKALLLGVTLAGLASCAWWQKHGGQIECAGIQTVENGPQLIEIVIQCEAVAVAPSAIMPCIRAAAGSQWADDVLQCFEAASQAKESCPAFTHEKAARAVRLSR